MSQPHQVLVTIVRWLKQAYVVIAPRTRRVVIDVLLMPALCPGASEPGVAGYGLEGRNKQVVSGFSPTVSPVGTPWRVRLKPDYVVSTALEHISQVRSVRLQPDRA
jgi:hypothetical protein